MGRMPPNGKPAFEYLERHPRLKNVVISGGDAFNMTAKHITHIGERLLSIEHIRRIRYATKGIAILPMKINTDEKWIEAFLAMHQLGRERGKQVVIHTHFSSPREVTSWSQAAMDRLFAAGVLVRNQALLQQGVNQETDIMVQLTKRLGYLNIQPYYVYIHDMVPGCEHLRTTLAEGVELEKQVRGVTAGFNTPTFVCDAPGGGGKRHVSSYEFYDQENGISIWRAPNVKPNELFVYFDPLYKLDDAANQRWQDSASRERMVFDAINQVSSNLTQNRKLESANGWRRATRSRNNFTCSTMTVQFHTCPQRSPRPLAFLNEQIPDI